MRKEKKKGGNRMTKEHKILIAVQVVSTVLFGIAQLTDGKENFDLFESFIMLTMATFITATTIYTTKVLNKNEYIKKELISGIAKRMILSQAIVMAITITTSFAPFIYLVMFISVQFYMIHLLKKLSKDTEEKIAMDEKIEEEIKEIKKTAIEKDYDLENKAQVAMFVINQLLMEIEEAGKNLSIGNEVYYREQLKKDLEKEMELYSLMSEDQKTEFKPKIIDRLEKIKTLAQEQKNLLKEEELV